MILMTMPLPSRIAPATRWSRLKAELMEGGTFLSLDDGRIEIGEYIDNYRTGGPVQYSPTTFGFGLFESDAV